MAGRPTREELERKVHLLEAEIEYERAEARLRDIERKYRELVDFLPQSVFEIDGEGRITIANRAAMMMTGYSEEDIERGMNVSRIFPKEDWEVLRSEAQRVVRGEKMPRYEYTVLRKDGATVPVHIYASPMYLDGRLIGFRGVIIDIGYRKQAEEAQRESEERFRALFERSSELVYISDFEGNFIDANPAALRAIGYDREDLPSLNFASLIDRDQFCVAMSMLDEIKRTGAQSAVIEYKLRRKDGGHVDIETMASVVFREGKPYAILGIARDISERKRAEEALIASEQRFQRLSITDNLTGLYNQRHFYDQLKLEIGRAMRYRNPLTILLLDVDNFKHYNDRFGHLEGDKVLGKLAEVVQNCLRQTDSAYRYGGEEFIVILPHTSGRAGRISAERIRSEFKKVVFLPGGETGQWVTVSVGVAEYVEHEGTDDFVRRADQNMYKAKGRGKDQVFFSA